MLGANMFAPNTPTTSEEFDGSDLTALRVDGTAVVLARDVLPVSAP
jgi:hypothetical protein